VSFGGPLYVSQTELANADANGLKGTLMAIGSGSGIIVQKAGFPMYIKPMEGEEDDKPADGS
jgi:hypothetical protein